MNLSRLRRADRASRLFAFNEVRDYGSLPSLKIRTPVLKM